MNEFPLMKRELVKSHVKYEKVNDFIENFNLCKILECSSKGHDLSLDNSSSADFHSYLILHLTID